MMTQVWQHSKAEGTRLLVLLAIADNANDDGVAWPSIDTIARKARVSPDTARRHVHWLARKKELEIAAKPGRSNKYRITDPLQTATPGRAVQEAPGRALQDEPSVTVKEQPLEVKNTSRGAASTDFAVIDRSKLTKVGGRNLSFDALADACAIDVRNKAQVGQLTKALKDIRGYFDEEVGALPDVSAEEWEQALAMAIHARASVYRQRFGRQVELTPTALSKWWHQLAHQAISDQAEMERTRRLLDPDYWRKIPDDE